MIVVFIGSLLKWRVVISGMIMMISKQQQQRRELTHQHLEERISETNLFSVSMFFADRHKGGNTFRPDSCQELDVSFAV
jgi:hypothetical protein